MIEKAQGLIFDLDGTIIDSSWVWDMVDIKFLGRYMIFAGFLTSGFVGCS